MSELNLFETMKPCEYKMTLVSIRITVETTDLESRPPRLTVV